MPFVEFALGVDHFGFDPQAELHALFAGLLGESAYAAGQFVARLRPVAQSLAVAVARIFFAEPPVVEQKHVYAEFPGLADEIHELLFVEAEVGGLPVVEQGHAVARAVLQLVQPCPVVQVAGGLSRSLLADGEDEFRCAEGLVLFQRVARGVGVDAGQQTQAAVVCLLEDEAEVARPAQRARQYGAGLLGGGGAEGELEEGRHEHVGACAELGVYHLLAVFQPLFVEVGLVGPVAVILREIVFAAAQAEHGRGVFLDAHGLAFAVGYLRVQLEHILAGVGRVAEAHFGAVDGIGERHHRFAHAVGDGLLRVSGIGEQGRGVAVGVVHVQGRFVVVLHAVCHVCLRAGGQCGVVGAVEQFASQIFLADASVVAYAEHQRGVVCVDDDGLLLRHGAGQGAESGEQQCFQSHVVFSFSCFFSPAHTYI